MMRYEKRAAASTAGDPGEKFVTSRSPRRFDGLLRLASQRLHVGALDLHVELEAFGELADEGGVRSTRLAAQLMVEMANDQTAVTCVREQVQKRDGIAPAGHPDQIPIVRWKAIEDRHFPSASGHAEAGHQRSTTSSKAGKARAI